MSRNKFVPEYQPFGETSCCEKGGSRFVRNVASYLIRYTTSYSRKHNFIFHWCCGHVHINANCRGPKCCAQCRSLQRFSNLHGM